MADPQAVSEPAFARICFSELSHRLLAWFLKNKREMPWREELDPYRIWISEIMLQQTRCETAADYYRRWLGRFPTVESLARARVEEVLKVWEGLGYYSRARNLHRAARIIVDSWGGIFPETEERIRSLPGVGEYTAAAVLSIAWAKPLGVADGNVLRVVSRLLADDGSAGSGGRTLQPAEGGAASAVSEARPANPGRLRRLARAFVEASFLHYHPGWINQAWMELGALVCLPNPRCSQCPLADACLAFKENRVDELPPRPSHRPLPIRTGSVLLLLPAGLSSRLRIMLGRLRWEAGGSPNPGVILSGQDLPLLLVRRADRGLLGGLWELPNYPERGEELRARLRGLSITILQDSGREVRQCYSHFEIRFRLLVAVFTEERKLISWTEQRWVFPAELENYPRPKVHIEAMHRFGLLGD